MCIIICENIGGLCQQKNCSLVVSHCVHGCIHTKICRRRRLSLSDIRHRIYRLQIFICFPACPVHSLLDLLLNVTYTLLSSLHPSVSHPSFHLFSAARRFTLGTHLERSALPRISIYRTVARGVLGALSEPFRVPIDAEAAVAWPV